MAEFDSIIYEKADGRVRLSLNRPEKLNAITMKMMEQLNEAHATLDQTSCGQTLLAEGFALRLIDPVELARGFGFAREIQDLRRFGLHFEREFE